MTHIGTQTIETPRLLLRRFRKEDVPFAFRNWTSDCEVTRFLSWKAHEDVTVTRDVINGWIESYGKDDWYQWGIELKQIGQVVGTISSLEINEKTESVTIGYCLGRPYWHQGYMSEALGAVIPFFFQKVGANRIMATHDVKNPYSGKVMEKCGMRLEGTLREGGWNNQGLCDIHLYSILKREFNG